MPDLLARLRAAGLTMGGRYSHGWRVGWTTDPVKAQAARDAGARVVQYTSSDPRFSGWEVTAQEHAP
jgi:hypothetical protein